jgi:hypothetical protein
VIYFIASKRGKSLRIKIGHAVDPKQRLFSLQISSPDRLRILATMPGDLSKEAEVQARFSEFKIRGEWFRGLPELTEFIQTHATAWDNSKARKASAPKLSLSSKLLESIKKSGLTIYALAQHSKVDEAAIRRFISGERSLSLNSADRLCDYLGLRLVEHDESEPKSRFENGS